MRHPVVVQYDRQDPSEIEFCWVFSHSLLSLVLLPFHFDNLASVSVCNSLEKGEKKCVIMVQIMVTLMITDF